MNDPAVAAAQRAEAQGWLHRQHAEAGAREALAPLRDLYEKWNPWVGHPAAEPSFSDGMSLILGELAPLIYDEEEL